MDDKYDISIMMIKDFIKGSKNIKKKLNELSKNKIINVIVPGNSALYIVKYLQKRGKCKRCKFITFAFSKSNDKNIESNIYLSEKMPNDYEDIVILDYIESGYTITPLEI